MLLIQLLQMCDRGVYIKYTYIVHLFFVEHIIITLIVNIIIITVNAVSRDDL